MYEAEAKQVRHLLERSASQLEELRVRLTEVDQDGHFEIGLVDGTVCVTRADEIDPSLQHLFRESVGNTRTALDRTVAYLARVAAPSGYKHRGYFPIFTSRADYETQNKKGVAKRDIALKYLSVEARALIDGVQPFTAAEPLAHPLALLAELSNEDKHRYGQPTWDMVRNLGVGIAPVDGDTVSFYDLIPEGHPIGERVRLEQGADLLAGFPPQAIEPFAEYLKEIGERPGQLMLFARTSVGFGPMMIRWPELRDALGFADREVVAPLLALLTADEPPAGS